MKIKEIELRSGMDRANIRYYEKEGLLQPERTENGYREYSEKDLSQLQKIRLLRSLHLSLDDIRSLIQNKTTLALVLKEQIRNLEEDKEDLEYAKSLCESIVSEGATFQTLDAEKHLMNIEEVTSAASTDYFHVDFEIPHVFEPIRRFVARGLDMVLYSVIIVFLMYIVTKDFSLENNIKDTFIKWTFAVLMMLIFEPIQLTLFKRTFGKWVMGLYIETLDGSPLSFEDSFRRTLNVYIRGLGLFLPLANLITLEISYSKLKNGEILSWDRGLAYRMKDRKIYRYIIAFFIYLLISVSVIVIPFWQNVPPNKGLLTVKEFTENFRHYQEIYGISFGNYKLNSFGKWEENEPNPRLDFLSEAVQYPQFRFRMNGDKVTEVNFSVTYNDNPFWVEDYTEVILLTSLAMINSDEHTNLFKKLFQSSDIRLRLYSKRFQSDSFSIAGHEVSSTVDYEGYDDMLNYKGYGNSYEYILVPANRERKNYYHHEFYIRKTTP